MNDDGKIKRVTVKRVKRVFDSFLKIDEALYSLQRYDGSVAKDVTRLSLERGDAAGALLLDLRPTSSDKSHVPIVWLVEQFRYSTYEKGPGWIRELPTGVIETGEDPVDTVRREVQEETGLEVENLEHITTFYVSPGGTSERIFLYFGQVDGQTPSPTELLGRSDEGEDIKLIPVSADAFIKEARLGLIDDAKTLIAGLWLGTNWQRIIGK